MNDDQKRELAELIVARAEAELLLERSQAKSTQAAKAYGNAKIKLEQWLSAEIEAVKTDLAKATAQTPPGDLGVPESAKSA